MKSILIALTLTAAITSTGLSADLPFPVRGEMRGVARVVDGDGLAIAGVEVRLQGIAAPEDNGHRVDPGGKDATEALRGLAEGELAVCYLDGSTTRGRPVGVCYVNGVEVGGALVQAGFARDCPRFSKGRYADAEQMARTSGRDLSSFYPLPRYCQQLSVWT